MYRCPVCGGRSDVIETRHRKAAKFKVTDYIWRRRRCADCDHRESTCELSTEVLPRLRCISHLTDADLELIEQYPDLDFTQLVLAARLLPLLQNFAAVVPKTK